MDTSKLDGFFESIKVIFMKFDTIQLYKELSNHVYFHFGQTILMTNFHKKNTCNFPSTANLHMYASNYSLDPHTS